MGWMKETQTYTYLRWKSPEGSISIEVDTYHDKSVRWTARVGNEGASGEAASVAEGKRLSHAALVLLAMLCVLSKRPHEEWPEFVTGHELWREFV